MVAENGGFKISESYQSYQNIFEIVLGSSDNLGHNYRIIVRSQFIRLIRVMKVIKIISVRVNNITGVNRKISNCYRRNEGNEYATVMISSPRK